MSDPVEAAYRVRDAHQAEKVDGVMLDAMTAAAIVAVYEALDPGKQAKLRTFPVANVARFAWKCVR